MRKIHEHQDPSTNKRRQCNNTECKLPFRSPDLVLFHQGSKELNRRTLRKRLNATREEQHERYIDCGLLNWDDR